MIMKKEITDNYDALSTRAGICIMNALSEKKDSLVCIATGYSPTGTYKYLVQQYAKTPELFAGMEIIKLDEWGGIAPGHPQSCETYIRQHIINPLNIPPSRYITFESNPADPELECRRVQEALIKKGPIDICILGLGANGHIGFNEPATALDPHVHIAKLSAQSLQHPMAADMDKTKVYGLTLGVADILQSKLIIILIAGDNKQKPANEFFEEKITTQLPASFLWMHPNVMCFADKHSIY